MTIVAAVSVSLAYWSGKVDINPLLETVDIRRGELWRVLTSALPHVNILHLIFNVSWTWIFGTLIEKTFGSLKTFAIFVLLSVAANGAEYAFLSGGMGLSGIGYGLFGLLWVLSLHDPRFYGVIDRNTITLFIAWFFLCIGVTLAGYPIGNVAHGVGAVTGALLGYAIAAPSPKRWAISAALAALVLAMLAGDTVARPWINMSTYGGYDEGKLAYDALMAEHNDEAIRWYRDATRMQPKIASYWFDMGIAYDREGHYAESAAAYARAAAIDPSDAEYQGALSHEQDVQQRSSTSR
jgi:GlpG protein